MKKIIFLTAFFSVGSFCMFLNFEPTVSEAAIQATSSVTLSVTSDLSLTGCSNATMGNALDLSYNSAVATTTCTVNSNTGYRIEIKATSSPSMKSGANSIDDYSTSTHQTWSTGTATNKKFGFTTYGTDVPAASWGTQTSCGRGGTSNDVSNTGALYTGLWTTGTTTATRNSGTPGGIDTIFCFGVGKGNSAVVTAGAYSAWVVFTAIAQ
jgi:hypothetical protein